MANDAVLIAAQALACAAAIACVFWCASVVKRDVSIVDSIWAPMQYTCALVYAWHAPALAPRAWLCLVLYGIWCARLSIYITWRNWGEVEDRRYRAMRTRNEPFFAVKSLYLIFLLQAFLAWLLALPYFPIMYAPIMQTQNSLGWLDSVAVILFAIGFAFEAIGDGQLARFKSDPAQRGAVLRTGLWRYTRHPNYFGEFCMIWALYLFAFASGGWWSFFAPVLLTFFLLRVSGVALLEHDIGERRPEYRDYIASTSTFFPAPPRARTENGHHATRTH